MRPVRSTRDVIIRTEQLAEAVRFYRTVLGFETTHTSDSLIGFETGSFQLYVERGAAHGAVFDMRVPDIEAAKQRLLAAGCVIVEEDRSVPRCYLRDPYGLVFNLDRES